jgi:hypothetical protein
VINEEEGGGEEEESEKVNSKRIIARCQHKNGTQQEGSRLSALIKRRKRGRRRRRIRKKKKRKKEEGGFGGQLGLINGEPLRSQFTTNQEQKGGEPIPRHPWWTTQSPSNAGRRGKSETVHLKRDFSFLRSAASHDSHRPLSTISVTVERMLMMTKKVREHHTQRIQRKREEIN